jgi:hypothetical protein
MWTRPKNRWPISDERNPKLGLVFHKPDVDNVDNVDNSVENYASSQKSTKKCLRINDLKEDSRLP